MMYSDGMIMAVLHNYVHAIFKLGSKNNQQCPVPMVRHAQLLSAYMCVNKSLCILSPNTHGLHGVATNCHVLVCGWPQWPWVKP